MAADLYENLLKNLAFRLDAERAHNIGLWTIAKGIIKGKVLSQPALSQSLFEVTFANPLGLAAGFDKNGKAMLRWEALGFGFAELGTVTNLPQPGNPKPRMFRVPQSNALINRLGFNNEGAAALAARLSNSPKYPLGINIGKNKEVPLEQAGADYAKVFAQLHTYGSYFVINVSSPNTPELRQLQSKAYLSDLVDQVSAVDPTRPLLVKIDPDLELDQLADLMQVAQCPKLTGLVATNTTVKRTELPEGTYEQGGLSGKPLTQRSNEVMRILYRELPKEKVLIGVGGISNGDDLFERLASGAHLCQAYSGFVYGGPLWPYRTLTRLTEILQQRGFENVTQVRGNAQVG